MNKEDMEKIWRDRIVRCYHHRTVWLDDYRILDQGEECKTHAGKAAAKNVKRLLSHSWPASPGYATGNFTPPDWLKERWKRLCPRNAKALAAAYGKGPITKYDVGKEYY